MTPNVVCLLRSNLRACFFVIAAAGAIGRWGALDDRALAHRVDLDRFGIIGGVLVLLLEYNSPRRGGRGGRQKGAGAVYG